MMAALKSWSENSNIFVIFALKSMVVFFIQVEIFLVLGISNFFSVVTYIIICDISHMRLWVLCKPFVVGNF